MSLRKKIALVVALVIIVSMPVSYFLWSWYTRRYGTYGYEREIVRKQSNLQEAIALAVAEYSNYSDIFGRSRLSSTSPRDYSEYTWAHFVDAEVIQYYSDRFDNLTEKAGFKPQGIKYRYEANVSTSDQIRAAYIPASEHTGSQASRISPKIQVQSLNGSVLLDVVAWGMEFAHWNGSEYLQISGNEVDFWFSKSYVVQMSLAYGEIWGTLGGFFSEVYQIVFMDENFVPLLLCLEVVTAIS